MNKLLSLVVLLTMAVLLTGCTDEANLPPAITAESTAAKEIRTKLATVTTTQQEEVTVEWGGQFATLTGRFTLEGAPPANPTLNVNKDLAVCNPSGGPVIDEKILVGDDKGLANVLIYADVPKEWCHETMVGNTDTVPFDQKNCLFLDRIFPMQTTQTLRLLNSDTVGHNASLKPSKNMEFNPNIAGGGEALYPPGGGTLKEEKTPFSVSCAAHPWMQSYLIFRDNGYFSVTGEDGKFALPNLPAGVPLKISVWHEASRGVPGKEVSAEPADIAKGWNKRGTFTLTLDPASPETVVNVAINSSALAK